MDEEAVDLSSVFLQEGFCNGFSFSRIEVAGLGIQDLDVSIKCLAEAFGTASRSARACGTTYFEDVTAVGQQFVHFLAGFLAFQLHIGTDVGDIQGLVSGDGAVDNDDGDIGILGFLKDCIPTIFNDWR